jgi:branched-chain amino acid transport system permease protein
MKRIGSYWLWILAVCFLVLFPLCFHSLFYINNMIDILIGALFGVSLNLLIGYTGLLSLGQNAFFGLGSYTMGVLLRQTSLGIPLTLLSLMFLGAVYAVFMGYFCTRLTRFYFAFLTLAFSQIVYIIIIKWTSLTGGQQGLIGGIPVPLIHLLPGLSVDIGPRLHFYYFTVVLVVGSFILCKAVVNSPFGWVLRSIRENATRAQFVGINIRRYQIGIFVISGIFTAVAGGLTALNISGAYPDHAEWIKGADPIFMILIGGMKNFFGPVVGAAVMVFLNTFLTSHTRYASFFLGAVMIFIVSSARMGLLDYLFYQKGVFKGASAKIRAMMRGREKKALEVGE